jgi:hypothetical protein
MDRDSAFAEYPWIPAIAHPGITFTEACGASGDRPDASGICVGFYGVVLNLNRCDPFIE